MSDRARDVRNRHLVIVLGCALVASCAASPQADAGARDAPARMACPSQDFTTFLQRYADPVDSQVRREFTADPLEHEVPTHRVEDETASSPPTYVSRRTGPARLELFQYRYFERAGVFDRVAPGEPVSAAGKRTPYPLTITVTANNGRDAIFGVEYEVDTFRFERKNGCWYLKRAIDLRD